jgi:hypothetical protein
VDPYKHALLLTPPEPLFENVDAFLPHEFQWRNKRRIVCDLIVFRSRFKHVRQPTVSAGRLHSSVGAKVLIANDMVAQACPSVMELH